MSSPWDVLRKDTVTLVKRDGRRFEGKAATVKSSSLILTEDPELPIEDGDHLERTLPSGANERYEILDAGYHERPADLGGCYRSKVPARSLTSTAEHEQGEVSVPFESFLTEKIALVKKSGERVEGIPACVQTSSIYTNDPTLPIAEGDVFERPLPNGSLEEDEILDVGYVAKFHGIGAHFQTKVRKRSALAKKPEPGVVINVNGGYGSRVNYQSEDSSGNLIRADSGELFDQLRETIRSSLDLLTDVGRHSRAQHRRSHRAGA